MATEKSSAPLSFEQTLDELEKIVAEMEQGDIPLQTALEKFERGVHLTKEGQATLQAAEQKVQILMEKNGQQSVNTFDASSDE
ncbi:exodeoxyribonuclease VII small subunit [Alteromonas oceanisediminis]|uniref:exodeoxyribonuclease VII small subunit n=1 Tax=Alteromonas oceanisediminis TaxID=2836180 RepID=UPI001BDAD034|nr:exodeoxyribonuclease VII small subunit [Alteromonas oceanisediminis]MBT0585824.1 exodeoxyribonuclease VII small subunit [Alteromonas oceanisediminis]